MPDFEEAIAETQTRLQATNRDDVGIMVSLPEGTDIGVPGTDYEITFLGTLHEGLFTEDSDTVTDSNTAVGSVRSARDPNGMDIWIGEGGALSDARVRNTIEVRNDIKLVVWRITEDAIEGPFRPLPGSEELIGFKNWVVPAAAVGAGAGTLAIGLTALHLSGDLTAEDIKLR